MMAPRQRTSRMQISPQLQQALAMQERGTSYAPVQHPLQGLARAAQAGLGAYQEHNIYSQAEEEEAQRREALVQLLGGGGGDMGQPQPGPEMMQPQPSAMQQVPQQQGGVSPDLIQRVIQQESGGDPNAVSPVGATGLMQIMPATARDPGYGVPSIFEIAGQMGRQAQGQDDAVLQQLLRDPAVNQAFGEQYLEAMINQHGGDEAQALAAYNAGPGAVQQYGGIPPYEETQNYVRAIQGAGGSQAQPAPQQPMQQQPAGRGVQQPDPRQQILAALEGGLITSDQASQMALEMALNPPESPGQQLPQTQGLPQGYMWGEGGQAVPIPGLPQGGEGRMSRSDLVEVQTEDGQTIYLPADQAVGRSVPGGEDVTDRQRKTQEILAANPGMDENTASNIATGVIRTERDPFSGRSFVHNLATGESTPMTSPGAGRDVPEMEVENPVLGDVSQYGGGGALSEAAQRATFGLFDAGPNVNERRQAYRLVREEVLNAYSRSGRPSNFAQQRIEELLPSNGVFESPSRAYDQLRTLHQTMSSEYEQQMEIYNDESMPAEMRRDAFSSAMSASRAMQLIGDPGQFPRPGSEGERPQPEAPSAAAPVEQPTEEMIRALTEDTVQQPAAQPQGREVTPPAPGSSQGMSRQQLMERGQQQLREATPQPEAQPEVVFDRNATVDQIRQANRTQLTDMPSSELNEMNGDQIRAINDRLEELGY